MISANQYDILIAPIYSEKATSQSALNKYVFKVSKSATKNTVHKVVEKIFNVKVIAVNIVNKKPETRVFKGIKGKKQGYKKAIVTLEKGSVINFNKEA